ncbi:hypothetical protein QTQ03_25960 [Micromonospora sp. WMMA1363]|nr:hypothetical protein [Micromonospora sp. WMMA1363]MDM4722878.1 hypothetical protein [Micromonospora sp. WMMA1363]
MLIPFATRPAHPHVLPLHPTRHDALLRLARLVQRTHRQATPAPTARRLVQTSGHEPPDVAHRRRRVPDRPVQQPLRAVLRGVPDLLGALHPLRFGI